MTTTRTVPRLTLEQLQVRGEYANRFSIPTHWILFLNDREPLEPWFNPKALLAIARQAPEIQTVSGRFDKYVEPLKRIFFLGTVILANGRSYEMTGWSTVGEHLFDARDDIDEFSLAQGRAMHAAMEAAGVNPSKPASLVSLMKPRPPVVNDEDEEMNPDEAAQRGKDVARIHVLAEALGLIKSEGGMRNKYEYRIWLQRFSKDAFGLTSVTSSTALSRGQRQLVISELQRLVREPERQSA